MTPSSCGMSQVSAKNSEQFYEKFGKKLKKFRNTNTIDENTWKFFLTRFIMCERYNQIYGETVAKIVLEMADCLLIVAERCKTEEEKQGYEETLFKVIGCYILLISFPKSNPIYLARFFQRWLQLFNTKLVAPTIMQRTVNEYKCLLRFIFTHVETAGNYLTQLNGLELVLKYLNLFNEEQQQKLINEISDSEIIKQMLFQFDINSFDQHSRKFLYTLNSQISEECSVYSVPAKFANFKFHKEVISPYNEETHKNEPLWINFNSKTKSISFVCDPSTFGINDENYKTRVYFELNINTISSNELTCQLEIHSENNPIVPLSVKRSVDASNSMDKFQTIILEFERQDFNNIIENNIINYMQMIELKNIENVSSERLGFKNFKKFLSEEQRKSLQIKPNIILGNVKSQKPSLGVAMTKNHLNIANTQDSVVLISSDSKSDESTQSEKSSVCISGTLTNRTKERVSPKKKSTSENDSDFSNATEKFHKPTKPNINVIHGPTVNENTVKLGKNEKETPIAKVFNRNPSKGQCSTTKSKVETKEKTIKSASKPQVNNEVSDHPVSFQKNALRKLCFDSTNDQGLRLVNLVQPLGKSSLNVKDNIDTETTPSESNSIIENESNLLRTVEEYAQNNGLVGIQNALNNPINSNQFTQGQRKTILKNCQIIGNSIERSTNKFFKTASAERNVYDLNNILKDAPSSSRKRKNNIKKKSFVGKILKLEDGNAINDTTLKHDFKIESKISKKSVPNIRIEKPTKTVTAKDNYDHDVIIVENNKNNKNCTTMEILENPQFVPSTKNHNKNSGVNSSAILTLHESDENIKTTQSNNMHQQKELNSKTQIVNVTGATINKPVLQKNMETEKITGINTAEKISQRSLHNKRKYMAEENIFPPTEPKLVKSQLKKSNKNLEEELRNFAIQIKKGKQKNILNSSGAKEISREDFDDTQNSKQFELANDEMSGSQIYWGSNNSSNNLSNHLVIKSNLNDEPDKNYILEKFFPTKSSESSTKENKSPPSSPPRAIVSLPDKIRKISIAQVAPKSDATYDLDNDSEVQTVYETNDNIEDDWRNPLYSDSEDEYENKHTNNVANVLLPTQNIMKNNSFEFIRTETICCNGNENFRQIVIHQGTRENNGGIIQRNANNDVSTGRISPVNEYNKKINSYGNQVIDKLLKSIRHPNASAIHAEANQLLVEALESKEKFDEHYEEILKLRELLKNKQESLLSELDSNSEKIRKALRLYQQKIDFNKEMEPQVPQKFAAACEEYNQRSKNVEEKSWVDYLNGLLNNFTKIVRENYDLDNQD